MYIYIIYIYICDPISVDIPYLREYHPIYLVGCTRKKQARRSLVMQNLGLVVVVIPTKGIRQIRHSSIPTKYCIFWTMVTP